MAHSKVPCQIWYRLHLDLPLLLALLVLMGYGLMVIYSASGRTTP